jgi:hypothetical protein
VRFCETLSPDRVNKGAETDVRLIICLDSWNQGLRT